MLDERPPSPDGPRMKAAWARVMVVLSLCGVVAPLASTLRAPPARADLPPREQTACAGKRPGDLCPMPDGAGGVCTAGLCDPRAASDPRACLTCTPGPVNTPGSNFPVGFLIVGAIVTLTCATVVILKLRRHWGDKP